MPDLREATIPHQLSSSLPFAQLHWHLACPPTCPLVTARPLLHTSQGRSNPVPPALPPFNFNNQQNFAKTPSMSLTIAVRDLIARGFPYALCVFESFTSVTTAALHYAHAQKTDKRQLGANSHTDFGPLLGYSKTKIWRSSIPTLAPSCR